MVTLAGKQISPYMTTNNRLKVLKIKLENDKGVLDVFLRPTKKALAVSSRHLPQY